MAEVQDQLEIKFRLPDGTDIGPKVFPANTSVENVKESVLSVLTQWPQGNGPKSVKDLKLISAGKILENKTMVGEIRSSLYEIPGGVTTVLVVITPASVEKEKKNARQSRENSCACVVL